MTVLVQSRVDQADKDEATAVLEALGLNMSQFLRMAIKTVAATHAVPAEFIQPNQKTIAAIKEARRGKLKRYNAMDALMADLDAGD